MRYMYGCPIAWFPYSHILVIPKVPEVRVPVIDSELKHARDLVPKAFSICGDYLSALGAFKVVTISYTLMMATNILIMAIS